jgi:hypothetical protein
MSDEGWDGLDDKPVVGIKPPSKEQSNAALFDVAMNTLRQIATTPRNRKARVNANAAVRFIETQMEARDLSRRGRQ